MKIRIPFIIENGVTGLSLTSFIGGMFHINGIKPDYLIVENESLFNTGTKKLFNLNQFKSILIRETELSSITKDFKIDPYKPEGKEIELFLISNDDKRIPLLPKFLFSVQGWGKKDWNRFLKELSEVTAFPIEVVNI